MDLTVAEHFFLLEEKIEIKKIIHFLVSSNHYLCLQKAELKIKTEPKGSHSFVLLSLWGSTRVN